MRRDRLRNAPSMNGKAGFGHARAGLAMVLREICGVGWGGMGKCLFGGLGDMAKFKQPGITTECKPIGVKLSPLYTLCFGPGRGAQNKPVPEV